MRLVVAGGSGFLGTALVTRLRRSGHDVQVLARVPRAPGEVRWTVDAPGTWSNVVDGAEALVNLAGESIASGRWTAARKARILESRIRTTRSLVGAIRSATRPPATFLSASAVGYYGPRTDVALTEEATAGTDFLADVCLKWEQEANTAESVTRVVRLRTGLVLAPDGGAFPRILAPFRLFAGGPVGSGRQCWSWIHRDDWVSMVICALLGEIADALLLTGQRVLPAQALGFRFQYESLDAALSNLV